MLLLEEVLEELELVDEELLVVVEDEEELLSSLSFPHAAKLNSITQESAKAIIAFFTETSFLSV